MKDPSRENITDLDQQITWERVEHKHNFGEIEAVVSGREGYLCCTPSKMGAYKISFAPLPFFKKKRNYSARARVDKAHWKISKTRFKKIKRVAWWLAPPPPKNLLTTSNVSWLAVILNHVINMQYNITIMLLETVKIINHDLQGCQTIQLESTKIGAKSEFKNGRIAMYENRKIVMIWILLCPFLVQ